MRSLIPLFPLILIILLIFKIHTAWPLSKPAPDPELENLASNFESTRDFLAEKTVANLPEPQASLLSGILLGVKNSLPKDFSSALRRTSTIHIVVVSGQNLTLLIGFVMAFAAYLGRKKTIVLSLFTVVIYSLITGLQIPVLRAALMVGLTLIAQLFGREKESAWVLLISGLLMLIYEPNWLLSVSFQLSFVATAGVIIVSPEIVKRLNFLPSIIKEDFGVSLSAQLLTWPIIAATFHQASLIGIIVNPLVLWTVSPVMIGGIFTMLGSIINPTLGNLIALFPATLLTYFVYMIDFFNSLPFASIYVQKTSPYAWLGYYILVLGVFLILKKSSDSKKMTRIEVN